MKKICSAASVLLLLCVNIQAQVVTLDPPFPELNEPVTVTYHATEGNGELSGVSPVYMHTGVTFSGVSGWQNVQGVWGTADPNVLMQQTAPNTHQATFAISDFYGLDPGEMPNRLAFVFRNADGTLVGRNADGSDIFVNIDATLPEIQDPPPGTVDGINYIDDTTVILQLFAPGKDYVYVIGDFTGWSFNEDYKCKVNSAGDRFWVQIDGLVPGQEYRFQYSIDDEDLRVADIYAEKILDPWNDQFIGEDRYPGLISYPFGLTTQIVSVLQTAQSEYDWEVENFFRPPLDRLVIYELLVRDFTEAGTFQAVIDTLDYLENLGINALELMPINEFEGNESWGYNPSFYFAVDKYYGTKDKLKELIDECHKRGIAVILDVVFNHSFGQNPQVRMYSENGPAGPPTADSPWFNQFATHPFSPGFDYNHDSPHTQAFMKRNMHFWIEEFKVDGYRFDLSKGFTQNNTGSDIGAWSAYDQSRIDHWLRIRSEIHEVDDNVYLILEHFSDNSEETALANAGFMLWGNNNDQFSEAGMAYASNLDGANYQNRGWAFPNLVSYAESHDEERLMFRNLNFGNSTNAAHDATDLETALRRMEAVAAFNILPVGPKMIWQFGELGYDFSINHCPDGSIDPDCRTSNKPVRWDYYFEKERRRLYKVYAALNKLKTENEAFSSVNYNYDVGGFGKRLIVEHSSMDVVVIANFDNEPLSFIPGFTKTGVWYDYFTGGSIVENNLSNPFTLEPGELRIYTTEPLPVPDISVEDVEVTFLVDMSFETVAPGGVGISGSFNDFEFEEMTSLGNGLFSYKAEFIEGESVEYKFRNGTAFEAPSGPCASGNFGNRVLTVPAADTLLTAVCYGSCVPCPGSETSFDLMLVADASELPSVSSAGIHVAGNFNGFTPEPMTDAGGGLYTFSVNSAAGAEVLWKYTDGPGFSGVESVPEACGADDGFGGFNRVLIMPAEETVIQTCFSSCDPCGEAPCDVSGGVLTALTSRSICVGTGSPTGIDIEVSGAAGDNMRWGLLDAGGNVLDVRSGNSLFNLDGYAPGDYSIRHVSYADGVSLAGVSSQADLLALEGCWDASNGLNIFLRPEPEGGTLSALTPTSVCAASGSVTSVQLSLSGAEGENGRFGILDLNQSGNPVVAAQNSSSFNLNAFPPGNYQIRHLSYQQGVNLSGVTFSSDLQGCYALSNGVNIQILNCSASLASAPNPVSGQAEVWFKTPERGRAVLEVYDASGRRVDLVYSGTADAETEYRFGYDTSTLTPGVYIYRLTTEGEVVYDKFIVAK